MFSNGSSPQTGPTTPESNSDEFGETGLGTNYVQDWTSLPMDSDPNTISISDYIHESALDNSHSSLSPPLVSSTSVPPGAWMNRTFASMDYTPDIGSFQYGISSMSPQPPASCYPPEAFINNHTSPNVYSQSPEPSSSNFFLSLLDAPKKSRVETQVKLTLDLRENDGTGEAKHVNAWKYINIPKTASVKQRPRPIIDAEPQSVLTLEVNTYCASSPDTLVKCCKSCQAREDKRNARKNKLSVPGSSEAESSMAGPAIISDEFVSPIDFTCYQMLDFGAGCAPLSFRVICYCRHYKEKVGFTIEFTLKNADGVAVGQARTHPILITDDHKTANLKITPATTADEEDNEHTTAPKRKRRAFESEDNKPSARRRNGSSRLSKTFSESPLGTAPSSPSNTHSPVPKAERSSQSPPQLSLFSPQLSTPLPFLAVPGNFMPQPDPYPKILRVVPSAGPTTGGVDVTILGENFWPEMMTNAAVFFGVNAADNIQFWGNSAMTCRLPPSNVPGVVQVQLLGIVIPDNVQSNTSAPLFTYTDEREKDLMIHALRMLCFQSTGQNQDPMQLARALIPQLANNNNGQGLLDTSSDMQHIYSGGMGLSLASEPHQFQQLIIDVLRRSEDPETNEVQHVSLPHESTGQTLLHMSAALGFTELTKELINWGADVDVLDVNGWSALGFACLFGNQECVRSLLHDGEATIHGTGKNKDFADICDEEMRTLIEEVEEERHHISKRKKSITETDVESGGEGDDEGAWSDEDERTFDDSAPPPLDEIPAPLPALIPPTRLSRAPSSASIKVWPEEAIPESPIDLDDDVLASTLPTQAPRRAPWRLPGIPIPRPSLPPMLWGQLPTVPFRFNRRGGGVAKDEEASKEFWNFWRTMMHQEAVQKQQAAEQDPPPAYSASPDDAGTAILTGTPAAPIIVDEPPSPLSLDGPSTSSFIGSRSHGSSRLHRRVEYPNEDPMSDREVNSFTYARANTSLRVKKKDKMLVFFWIPFLFLFFTWAVYKSIPIAYQFFELLVPRKHAAPTWRSSMLRGY